MAQPRASPRATCGSSGCVGGSLPVVLVHTLVMTLRITNAAAIAARPPMILVVRSALVLSSAIRAVLSAIPTISSSHARCTGPAFVDSGGEFGRVPGADQPVGDTRVGQRQADRLLEVRSRIQPGSRVGVRAAQPARLLFAHRDRLGH